MKVDQIVSRREVHDIVLNELDSMAITDIVYHEFEYTRLLVEDILFQLMNRAVIGDQVSVIGSNSLLAQCILKVGYDLHLWLFGENILASELEPNIRGRVTPEMISDGQSRFSERNCGAIILPMVVEHVFANPSMTLGFFKPSLHRDGVLITATRNAGSLGLRSRAFLGMPYQPDLRQSVVHFSMNWPDLQEWRYYLRSELAQVAQDGGFMPLGTKFSMGHQAFKRTDFFGIRSYCALMTKHWMKKFFPSLRDYFVLSLRHATADEIRRGLVPITLNNTFYYEGLPAPSPFVSVVLPTHNRSGLLRNAIEGLMEQEYPAEKFEVIVVDDGSTDDTGEVITKFHTEAPFTVKHIKTTGIGAIEARNMGMREASGEIVAHIDDDCRPSPEWLVEGASCFRGNIAIVSGAIELKPEQSISFFCFAPRYTEDTGIYPTANVFYRRDIALDSGGFDPSFGGNILGRPVSGWDADLGWRLRRLGHGARFSYGAVAYQEVFKLTPMQWLMDGWRAVAFPTAVKRVPELGQYMLFLHVFGHWLNFYFDLSILGIVLALGLRHIWPLLLTIPWVLWCLRQAPHDRWPPSRWPKWAAKIMFLHLRQIVTLCALSVGSIRAKRLVL